MPRVRNISGRNVIPIGNTNPRQTTPPEPTTNTKNKKIFSNEVRRFLRKAIPDPIGKSAADELLDSIEIAVTQVNQTGYKERIILDSTLIGQELNIEESTVFIVEPSAFSNPNNTVSLNLETAEFYTQLAFIIQPSTVDWYMNIRSSTPFLPHPGMINNINLDTPPYITWNLKISSQIFSTTFIVIPDLDGVSRAFGLLHASFNTDFSAAYGTSVAL